MNISYYQKLNNIYKSKSKQETERWLINRNEEKYLYDNVDKEDVLKNGEPFEILIIKGSSDRNKKIKSVNSSPFNLGDYIEFNNMIYLVTSLDPDDKVHHSGTMQICMYKLIWQRKDGSIVERWAVSEDFTKYDSGQTSNGILTIASNQYGLIVPIDDDTKLMPRDKRFVMDVLDNKDVENGAIPDTYTLTNEKPILNDYRYFGRGGTMTFTTKFDSFNPNADKWIDGHGWICDYFEPQVPTPEPTIEPEKSYAVIDGKDTINGGRKRSWKAKFYDLENNEIEVDDFSWEIESDFDVTVTTNNEVISLVVDKDNIGKELVIKLIQDDTIIRTKTISVVGM